MSVENEELKRWMDRRTERSNQKKARFYHKSDVQNITDFEPNDPGLLDMNDILGSEQNSFLSRSNNVMLRIRELVNQQKRCKSNLTNINDEVIANIFRHKNSLTEEEITNFENFQYYYCGLDDFSDRGSTTTYNEYRNEGFRKKDYETVPVKFEIYI